MNERIRGLIDYKIFILMLAFAVFLSILSFFGFRPMTLIEVENETVAEQLEEKLKEIIPIAVGFTLAIGVTIPLAPLIYAYSKEKYELWYVKHFPHRIPFGEKWNRMLERLDYMAYLEREYGFHFNYEGDEK